MCISPNPFPATKMPFSDSIHNGAPMYRDIIHIVHKQHASLQSRLHVVHIPAEFPLLQQARDATLSRKDTHSSQRKVTATKSQQATLKTTSLTVRTFFGKRTHFRVTNILTPTIPTRKIITKTDLNAFTMIEIPFIY